MKICERVLPHAKQMIIDNDNNHRITNFNKVKKEGHTNQADHTPMWIKIDLKISPDKPEKTEVINFKDKEAQNISKTTPIRPRFLPLAWKATKTSQKKQIYGNTY